MSKVIVIEEPLAKYETPAKRQRWVDRINQLIAFRAEHGRLPVTGGDPEESRMWGWISSGRSLPSTHPVRKAVDTHFPRRQEHTFTAEQRVAALKDYRDAYGTFPSGRSRDPQTRELARWLYNKRNLHCGEATRALLEEHLPGWDESPQQAWERTVLEVAEFRKATGELPSGSSRDPKVKARYRWLADMRRGRGLTPERAAFLDRELPGWRDGMHPGERPAQLAA